MRDPERIPDVLAALERYWKKNPDLRLGQIVVYLTERARAARGQPEPFAAAEVFYVEDEPLLRALSDLSLI